MLEMLEQDEHREDQQEAGGGLPLMLQHPLDSNGSAGGGPAGSMRGRGLRCLPVMEALENDEGEEEEPAARGTPLLVSWPAEEDDFLGVMLGRTPCAEPMGGGMLCGDDAEPMGGMLCGGDAELAGMLGSRRRAGAHHMTAASTSLMGLVGEKGPEDWL